MQVNMNDQLWYAVIIAIDGELDEYKQLGTSGDPELDIRYGKMLQARGYILRQMREDENA
tara:strand:- start:38 stop:217 length:180 start_codon:yes stop_codon:yes gene_type:complete